MPSTLSQLQSGRNEENKRDFQEPEVSQNNNSDTEERELCYRLERYIRRRKMS